MKRQSVALYTSLEKGDLPDEVIAYLKREFSAEQRQRDAASGAAMPDGSFPIENASDLHNAMRAIGRAKDPAKAKAHIRARARALGLTAELSEAFKRDDARSLIGKAAGMLIESVRSIVGFSADATKENLIDKSIEEFTDHLSKAVGAGDALDPAGDPGPKGSDAMSPELLKALGLTAGATDADAVAALVKINGNVAAMTADVAKLKADMNDEEQAFHDGLTDDDEKEKFRGMTRAARAERMKKRDHLPADVRKALDENEDMKKRLQKLEDERALDALTKQATDLGLPTADGETLQKAYRGDKGAVDKLLSIVKALTAQVKAAGLFKELGDGRTGGAGLTAQDELVAKADELRKKDPALTREQAFAKIYADPVNAELAKRERAENRPAAA